MINAPSTKTAGTNGTNGTTLISNENSGLAVGSRTGTNGTASATNSPRAQAMVPVVPPQGKRTGPQKANNFNAVPLVPLVPPENGNSTPDLFAAFEAIFAAAETRETVPEPKEGRCECFETADAFVVVASPDLDAFAERAAIRGYDGGEDRGTAERAAAAEQGYSDPASIYAAATRSWRRKLEIVAGTLFSCSSFDPRGQVCIRNALRFFAEGSAGRALALGWPELELFGVDPRTPCGCLDRLGAAYRAGPVIAICASKIIYSDNQTLWIAQQADGAVWPWEILPGAA